MQALDRSQAERLRNCKIDLMTDAELEAVPSGSVFVFDVECYVNFFFVALKCLDNGKFVTFEQSPDSVLDVDKLGWMLWKFCIVGFNSKSYDLPIISFAMSGASCAKLKEASDFIIVEQQKPYMFARHYGITIQDYNQVDLIEVAPLQGSLKLYAGRLHCKTMQDLPFKPEQVLTKEDAEIIRPYCSNDLENTELLFNELAPGLKLRLEMSKEYQIELRSKSDAQVAEAVICNRLKDVLGYYPKPPKFNPNLVLRYNAPDFIRFESDKLNQVFDTIKDAVFELDGNGSPVMPKALEKLDVRIGQTVYKLGMGGLHSQEKSVSHVATEDILIRDNDVASYYPRIILNQRLFPTHLGEAFLTVYENIVNERLHAKAQTGKAKKAGNKAEEKLWKSKTDSLKITINGSFGKLGNKYSALYAPQLMLQVTLTGQLCLLMLIEMLEAIQIPVISGNTDGIISKYPKSRHEEVRAVIREWEDVCGYETEETAYKAIYSRDVNSYIAIKEEGGDVSARFLDDRLGCKTKGTYSERGSALNSVLSKNPEHLICTDAVLQYLVNKIPVADTIKSCTDIRRFVTVKNVKGGGHKDGLYLGKVVRWYYAKGEFGCIQYVTSGNKVATSDGAKPLMDLPTKIPEDIDFDWYIEKANSMLVDCGAVKPRQTQMLFFN